MRISLSIKIALAVVLVILLQTSILLAVAYDDLIDDEKHLIKNDMRITMSRMQHSLEFLLERQEAVQVQSELSYLGAIPHISMAILVDENNRITASSNLAYIGENLGNVVDQQQHTDMLTMFKLSRDSEKSILRMTQDESSLLAIYPVDLGLADGDQLIKRRMGVIYVDVDLLWISDYVWQILREKVMAMLLLLGFIGFIFVILINRFIVHRINSVNIAASEFSRSGYKSRAEVKGSDELSELAESFNHMADTVEDKSEELIKQEESISMLLDFMDNGVISIDERGVIHSFNKSACKIFGYTEEEVIGKNVKILMPDPYRSAHDGYINNYLETGHAKIIGLGRDVIAQHKKGHEFMMHLHVSEMPASEDRQRMFIGTCLDVTLQKQQEMQLRHSQKMDALGKLTGGIAHDYNNMLGVILGYSELIKDELADNPRLLKFVNEIYHAGSRGAKLTKKLLSFSRKKSAESSVVNINTILNDNRHMLEKTLTVRVKIDFSLDSELWPAFLDANDFEDAILNMCINAMHAMEGEQGEIVIKTENEHLNEKEAMQVELETGAGDYVCISVCDNGSGMSEEILGKIFDPFFTTKADKGNGLGLSQVYGFVHRSHGGISVESEVGKGSCFKLYFPRYLQHVNPELDMDVHKAVAGGTEKILVVDDESALSELLEAILSSHGYQVTCVESGQQALQQLESGVFSLVISDVLMPGMDGYELAKLVRRDYPGVKIQLISGFSDSLHKKNKDEELYSMLLHKPFDRQQLLLRIRELLDKVDETIE